MAGQYPQIPAFSIFDDVPMRRLEFNSPLPRLPQTFQSNSAVFDGRIAGTISMNNPLPISKFEDTSNELVINFDIFGNPIKDNGEFSLLSTSHSSYKKYDENFFSSNKNNEISMFKLGNDDIDIEEEEEEENEWDIDKENVDPVGNLITPSKPKRLSVQGASRSSRRNNSGRSPLQDITPPVGIKKSPVDSFRFDAAISLNWTPKDDRQSSNIKSFR